MYTHALSELLDRLEPNTGYFVFNRNEFGTHEDLPEADRILNLLVNFVGTAGILLAYKDADGIPHVSFVIDPRYENFAREVVPEGVEVLVSPRREETLGLFAKTCPDGATIEFNPKLVSVAIYEELQTLIADKGITLRPENHDTIGEIWQNRPARPKTPIFFLNDDITGRSSADTVTALCSSLREQDVDFQLLGSEDTCWLFNMRGGDVPYRPIMECSSVVDANTRHIYLVIDPSRIDAEAKAKLGDNVSIVSPDNYLSLLRSFVSKTDDGTHVNCLQLDKDSTPVSILLALNEATEAEGKANVKYNASPLNEAQAVCNMQEIEGMHEAHLHDGLAYARFRAKFDKLLRAGENITEWQAYQMFLNEKNLTGYYVDEAFSGIFASGENGPNMHHHPVESDATPIKNGLLLIDNGAHYANLKTSEGKLFAGTTDMSRTLCIGDNPTDEMRETYTAVLLGHLAVRRARFEKGTVGHDMDQLARQYLKRLELKKEVLDFKHSTGHPIRPFLNVHGGEHGLRPKDKTVLEEGMILSNEPGYYSNETGNKYGIRIENVLVVTKLADNTYGFDDFTLAPYDLKCINFDKLSVDDIKFINAYHRKVRDKLLPHMNGPNDEEARRWLKRQPVLSGDGRYTFRHTCFQETQAISKR